MSRYEIKASSLKTARQAGLKKEQTTEALWRLSRLGCIPGVSDAWGAVGRTERM